MKTNKLLILILIFIGQCSNSFSAEQTIQLKKIPNINEAPVEVTKAQAKPVQKSANVVKPIVVVPVAVVQKPVVIKQQPSEIVQKSTTKTATQKPVTQQAAKITQVQTNQLQTSQQQTPVEPQPVDFSLCNKTFKVDSQKLFYLTLAAINANRFSIDEIQSKSGYILFTAAKKQYLASVISLGAQSSILKITPYNNIYIFPVGIVQNMFKYIELNQNTPIEKLNLTQ